MKGLKERGGLKDRGTSLGMTESGTRGIEAETGSLEGCKRCSS